MYGHATAKRILFLVDRLELEDQAAKNFKKWLHNDYTCLIYKENKDDWRKAEIVITTVQSLSFDNKYQRLFSPTDFELVISDEAHGISLADRLAAERDGQMGLADAGRGQRPHLLGDDPK